MQDEQEQAHLHVQLARMKLEHGDLHMAIEAMNAQRCDPLAVQRMKKKKLDVKDRMEKLASRLIPDLPA